MGGVGPGSEVFHREFCEELVYGSLCWSFRVFCIVNERDDVGEDSVELKVACAWRVYVCCLFRDASDPVGFL